MSVSVIMPHFNHGAVLPRAVEAMLGQTLAPTEIIIVDDASSAEGLAAAEAVAQRYERVRLIRHASNMGPNAGVNTGLAVASGEFVTFAAADDLVEPGFLQHSVEALSGHEMAAYSFLDPSRRLTDSGRVEHVPLALSTSARYFDPDSFADLLRRNFFTVSSNTVVYRRRAVAAIGGFRTDLKWQADWMANLILGFRHGAVYSPRALAHFSVDPASYGEAGVRAGADQRELTARCLAAIETDYPDVAGRFRHAGMVPEMSARTLWWMTRSAQGRRFLTWHLACRLLLREAWAWLRPFTPMALRRWARRRTGGAATYGVAA